MFCGRHCSYGQTRFGDVYEYAAVAWDSCPIVIVPHKPCHRRGMEADVGDDPVSLQHVDQSCLRFVGQAQPPQGPIHGIQGLGKLSQQWRRLPGSLLAASRSADPQRDYLGNGTEPVQRVRTYDNEMTCDDLH